MGGKNKQAPPPPVDNSANQAAMAQMGQIITAMMASQSAQMGRMMQQMQQAQQQVPTLPEVFRQPDIDWTEKTKQIQEKMKADYKLDKARRVGRSETVLTSPFLEDDEPNLTGTLLQ